MGNALCAYHKTGYKKKGKSTEAPALPEQQSVCGTCGNGFRGKKHQKESPIRKNTDSFFVFIVYTCRILLQ